MVKNPKEELSGWDLRLMVATVGLGLFVVFFILSMAVTCAWARHHWPGDGQAVLVAIFPSLIVAVILTIIACVFLAKYLEKEKDSEKS